LAARKVLRCGNGFAGVFLSAPGLATRPAHKAICEDPGRTVDATLIALHIKNYRTDAHPTRLHPVSLSNITGLSAFSFLRHTPIKRCSFCLLLAIASGKTEMVLSGTPPAPRVLRGSAAIILRDSEKSF
jgi:hypothetical protein